MSSAEPALLTLFHQTSPLTHQQSLTSLAGLPVVAIVWDMWCSQYLWGVRLTHYMALNKDLNKRHWWKESIILKYLSTDLSNPHLQISMWSQMAHLRAEYPCNHFWEVHSRLTLVSCITRTFTLHLEILHICWHILFL